MGKTSELHRLLNRERTKRGLARARWNQELWHGCKAHSNRMLRARGLFHADVNLLPSGGECVVGGKGRQSAVALCKSWVNSPGHAALILNPNIKSHAVAVSDSRYGTYATWRGSKEAIPILSKPLKLPNLFKLLIGRKTRPTNPFKIGLSLVLGVMGFLGMVLGVHGIYVYFNRLDLILGGEGARLFLVIDVPVRLRESIVWASARGLQSWFIPTLIFLAGLWVFNYSRLWTVVSRFIDKIRP